MTPSPRKPHRFGGLQVRICGHPIQRTTNSSIVCQRPPGDKHNYHAATAVDAEGNIYAILLKGDQENAEVEVWQLTGG